MCSYISCTITDCIHNKCRECQAEEVEIDIDYYDKPKCLSYEKRYNDDQEE